MGRILFLDDDAFQMKYHVQELKKLFDVELRIDVDRALDDFRDIKEVRGPWAGAVLDVMMPPGRLVESCPNGMHTGWHIFSAIRKIQRDLPVIVLTNLHDEEFNSWFRSEPNVRVLDKVRVLPRDLCAAAKEMFAPKARDPKLGDAKVGDAEPDSE